MVAPPRLFSWMRSPTMKGREEYCNSHEQQGQNQRNSQHSWAV
jgi:hypothetical protein